MWRLLEEDTYDVFRNLALEEAIARVNAEKEEKVNTLRFWRSDSAVILGRFQCVHKEVNMAYCKDKGIEIARRFTGGGTVFHDKNNLNFAICLDQSEPYVNRTLNELYWNFIGGIATSLREIGILVNFDSYRSCLRIKGKNLPFLNSIFFAVTLTLIRALREGIRTKETIMDDNREMAMI